MKRSCVNCGYCIPMYVPPVKAYENIPKDGCVCDLFRALKESDKVQYIGNGTGMCEMYSPKVITYESDNGYSGKLYGESSMSIYDKNGKEVFHTKYRNALTEEDLKKEVDGFPALMEMLKEF